MYFIFPDNLPVSVQKAAFEFTSGQFPLYRYITPDTEILNRGISIAIPDEASHIRSIRLTTSLSHFTYYYPEKGYKIAQGIHLPPFRVPAVGDLYANGVIIQAGADSPGQHIEPDIAPYKGSVMEIREQTLDYFDALIYCEIHFRRDLRQLAFAGYAQSGITAHQATGNSTCSSPSIKELFYTTRNTGAKTTA